MVNLPFIIIPLVAGIAAGYLMRGRKERSLNKVTLSIILVLIFSLGFTIGSNSELLNSMPKVGLSALAMALLSMGFSIVLVVLVRRKLRL